MSGALIRQESLPPLERLLHPIALVLSSTPVLESVSFPLLGTDEAELHGQAEPDGTACPLVLAPLYLRGQADDSKQSRTDSCGADP